MFKVKSIRIKIIAGCLCIVALVAVAGLAGYRGINTVGRSLFIVGSEEAPLVDMANEMKIALAHAQNAMREYDAASSAMATDDAQALNSIVSKYQATLTDFDAFADAILEGATFEDGTSVIKTDNDDLAELVRRTDDVHNNKFQVAAQEMMSAGQQLLAQSALRDESMTGLEDAFDQMHELTVQLEDTIKQEMDEQRATGNVGVEASILENEIPLADMTMEAKVTLGLSRIKLEELVQMGSLEEVGRIEEEYFGTITEFDVWIGAMLEGGDTEMGHVNATKSDAIRALAEETDRYHNEVFQAAGTSLIAAHRSMIEQKNTASASMERVEEYGSEAEALLTQVEDSAREEMTNAKVAGEEATTTAITALALIVVSSMAVGVTIGVLLSRMIAKPIATIVARIEEIAQGDLTKRVEIKRNDELGRLGKTFDDFVEKFHAAISEVSQSSGEVASASAQIAASAEEMAAGLASQQEQTTQVSAAVEEMTATVAEVSAKSSDAADAAKKSGSEATEGGQVVSQTVDEMSGISDQVNVAAAAVSELGKKGEQIGEIISVINDIADQTNLLALNAAIEAARAGEHGRGFAVVADEVRKLAERTTDATEEVGKSIREIQDETSTAVTQIQAGTERVGKGVELASSAGEALSRIVDGSQNVQNMVQSIAASSEQQSAASTQIAQSIEQIDSVTRESLEGAQQAANAASQLSSQAEGLQTLVGQFKI